jgi:alanine racemase
MAEGAGKAGDASAEAGGILEIDLAALYANYRDLAARAAPATCAAVVKADAYGIGLEAASRTLVAAGCDTFFVALIDEARRLRAVAPKAAIYVLNGLNPGTAAAYGAIGARPVLGSRPEIEEWDAHARQSRTAPAALHIDTGMMRHGLTPAEANALADGMSPLSFKPSLIMSHLACADDPQNPMTGRQTAAFRTIAARFPGIPASLANSAGLLAFPDTHFDLVRPGIALYGGAIFVSGENPMRAVVRIRIRVIQVREAKSGDGVGYGSERRLTRDSKLAILSAGYGDGIPRAAGSSDKKMGAEVIIGGRRCPLVGRVSMDLVIADVTDLPDGAVRRGDLATLVGDGISVDDLGQPAGTVGYEVLTRLGRRYHRVYA